MRRMLPGGAAWAAAVIVLGCAPANEADRSGVDSTAATAADTAPNVERGRYLVTFGDCSICHTPKVFGDQGPMPDTTRFLSGHRADVRAPRVPANVLGPRSWGALAGPEFTMWAGPWGVSYAANLTPDATGLGGWTVEQFVQTMRTGKHLGVGRPILPPMPWETIGSLTESDLRSIFAYLRTIPPVNNAVPAPLPPAQTAAR